MKPHVITFVFNNCKNDARVLKESKTLVDAGYRVTIYALLDKDTVAEELRDGIEIRRVLRNPIHLKWIRKINSSVNRIYRNPIHKRWIKKIKSLFSKKSFLVRIIYKLISKIVRSNVAQEVLPESREKGWLPRMKDKLRKFASKNSIQSIKESKVKLLAYGWVLILLYFVYRFFRWCIVDLVLKPFRWISVKIIGFLQKKIKSILMLFHRPLSFWDYYYRVNKLIKNESPDFYHCNDFNTLLLGYYRKKKTGGKLIYDSHELYLERNRFAKHNFFYKKVLLFAEKKMMRYCDGTITVGECIADYLRDLYTVQKPIVVMNAPNKNVQISEDIDGIDIRKEIGIGRDKKLLLYSGAITFNRGIEQLIESMKQLPGCHLLLLGYGKEEFLTKLKKIVVENRVQDRFSIYGPVPHHLVTTVTKQADLGIAPILNVCLSYYYCAPNKVFEYLLGGIPVIGSDFPEIKKIVEGFKVGQTFDPEDPDDIAKSVKNIFSNEEDYRAMKNRTKSVAKDYCWELEGQKLLTLYEGLR